eukprot:2865909-Rhodomonas_salina.1
MSVQCRTRSQYRSIRYASTARKYRTIAMGVLDHTLCQYRTPCYLVQGMAQRLRRQIQQYTLSVAGMA